MSRVVELEDEQRLGRSEAGVGERRWLAGLLVGWPRERLLRECGGHFEAERWIGIGQNEIVHVVDCVQRAVEAALEPASVRQADCDAAALPIVLHARLLDDEAGGVGFPLN